MGRQFLKESLRKKARNRLYMMVGGIVILLGMGVALWPRSAPPEETIGWPRDSADNPIEQEIESNLGGFVVFFPGTVQNTRNSARSELAG